MWVNIGAKLHNWKEKGNDRPPARRAQKSHELTKNSASLIKFPLESFSLKIRAQSLRDRERGGEREEFSLAIEYLIYY